MCPGCSAVPADSSAFLQGVATFGVGLGTPHGGEGWGLQEGSGGQQNHESKERMARGKRDGGEKGSAICSPGIRNSRSYAGSF